MAQHFGCALRCVKRSLNCYEMVCHLTGTPSLANNYTIIEEKCIHASLGIIPSSYNVASFVSFAFGLAGDSYYKVR